MDSNPDYRWIRIRIIGGFESGLYMDSNLVRNQQFYCAGLHILAAPVSSNNDYSLKQAVPEPMFSVL